MKILMAAMLTVLTGTAAVSAFGQDPCEKGTLENYLGVTCTLATSEFMVGEPGAEDAIGVDPSAILISPAGDDLNIVGPFNADAGETVVASFPVSFNPAHGIKLNLNRSAQQRVGGDGMINVTLGPCLVTFRAYNYTETCYLYPKGSFTGTLAIEAVGGNGMVRMGSGGVTITIQ